MLGYETELYFDNAYVYYADYAVVVWVCERVKPRRSRAGEVEVVKEYPGVDDGNPAVLVNIAEGQYADRVFHEQSVEGFVSSRLRVRRREDYAVAVQRRLVTGGIPVEREDNSSPRQAYRGGCRADRVRGPVDRVALEGEAF